MSTSFDFPSKDFIPVRTGDGSLTLLGPQGEHMHSLEGALAETLYIYAPVAQKVLQEGWPPRFCSVGLGVAYVELVIVAQALRSSSLSLEKFYLYSFESEQVLKQSLMDYFSGRPSALHSQVLKSVAQSYDLPPSLLFSAAAKLLNDKKWVLGGSLNKDTPWEEEKFSGLFFDAFSSKSSPELWTEDFLSGFLDTFAGNFCALSTYAATGALRRVLQSKGFEVERRSGFGKKRQSLSASRAPSL